MPNDTTSFEYAIVDIETTGGHAAGGGITEVAIVIHDGTSIIDRYETLINPQRHIPYFIKALTGIDDDMVAEHLCGSGRANLYPAGRPCFCSA